MAPIGFTPFSFTHLAVIATIVLATIALCCAGRAHRPAVGPTRLEVALGLANLFVWVFAHTYWLLPAQFDARTSLPLQMCHVAALVSSFALLTGRRGAYVLLYYWGIGLSTQALVTPSLTEGPGDLWFWVFWQQHGMLPVVAVYGLVAHGIRPGWRDLRMACVASAAYVAAVLPINLAFDLNYGFVGAGRPDQATVIDLLGPWPQRLLSIFTLVATVLALMTWPWTRAGRPARAARLQ